MLEFRMLGPLEVWRDGVQVPIEAPRERAVLAALLLQANHVVTADRLIELLWEDPPAKARSTVQTWVWRLRRRLAAADVLLTRPPGYALRIGPEQCDLLRFEALLRRGRRAVEAGSAAEAAALLGSALSLWRGEPLADVASEALRRLEGGRLAELHVAAKEAQLEAELLLGRHDELVGELRSLVADHPLRERLSGQLMTALYRSGRQAEALEAYRTVRAVLAEELGVEPGPALRQLHAAVLHADPSLSLPVRRVVPDAARPRAPAQLPPDVSTFTGRAGPLAELDRVLADARRSEAVGLCAIVGTAGVGKTALAVHWAHTVRREFPDGQLHVDLRGYAARAPVPPVAALARFLRALGVPAEHVPLDVDEATDLYRTQLADRQLLVVLDNAYSAEQVRPLLPGSAGCLVLVTSRDRLVGLVAREGAHRLTPGALDPDESRRLLERIVGAERLSADPGAAAELAELCVQLPLALRIAAANLTNHPHTTLAGYVAALRAGNRLAALAVPGDEQTAVRAAFDHSYAALPAAAQRAFRLLGLVPGPDVSAGAASALLGVHASEAAALLDQLAAAHLLEQPAPRRYALHDLLRLYASQRTEDGPAERAAALARLFASYQATAAAAADLLYPEKLRLPPPARAAAPAFDVPAHALEWLDAERANLVAAVVHAAEHGPREVAWQLADTVRGYFYLRMHVVDWLTVAEAGLGAATADGDQRGQAAAHISLADIAWRQSRQQRAIEHYARALTLSRQSDWAPGEAAAMGNMGTVHWQCGRPDEAAGLYRQALALNRRMRWREGEATALGNLGTVYWELGQLTDALEVHGDAVTLHRKGSSRNGEAIGLNNRGEVLHALGRLDEALDDLNQALALHSEVGNRASEAETLRCIAAVHRDAGRLGVARNLAERALESAREVGNRRAETDALNAIGTVRAAEGDPAAARDAHQRALALARESGSRYPEAEALLGLAQAHLARADVAGARASARQALLVAGRGSYRVLEGHALTALSAAHLAAGDVGQAVRTATDAADIQRRTGHRLGADRANAALAAASGSASTPA